MQKIQYKNLIIRQAEAADAKQLAAWWNDGAVMAHAGFPNGVGTTEEEVAKGLGKGSLIIQENDRLIGECNYRNLSNGVAVKWSRVISVYSGVLRRGRRANRYRKHSRKKKVCIE